MEYQHHNITIPAVSSKSEILVNYAKVNVKVWYGPAEVGFAFLWVMFYIH